MRVTLASDLGSLQNTSISKLDQNLFTVKLVGMAIVVGLDAAHKVRLTCYHLGQKVH